MSEFPDFSATGRHRGGSQARRSGLLAAKRLGKVVAALVSASLLLAMAYYRHTYNSLDRSITHIAIGAPSAATDSKLNQVDGKAQNLLLIGDDSRDGLSPQTIKKLHVGASDGTTSTDTLLIVHIPADGSKATLISIPRDSYVDIPGFPKYKINAAYIDGYNYGAEGYPVTSSSTPQQRQAAGLTLLNRVVENLTGVPINNDVMVNFTGFYTLASAIGGIDVDLCHSVNDTGAANDYQAGSGFKMSAGFHHLTPVEALQFVRQRHNIPDGHGGELGDIGREARQRYFLAAAFKAMQSAQTLIDPSRLNSLIDAIRQTLTIGGDLSLIDLAHQMADLSSGNIVGQTIPNEGTENVDVPADNPPGNVVLVDPAKVQAQVQAWLDPSASPSPKRSTSSSASSSSSSSSGSASSGSSAPKVEQADKGCIN